MALNLLRFFAYERCGQCAPCRVGTEETVALMQSPEWDFDLLGELSHVMRNTSICGLGQAAPNPLQPAIKFLPEDLAPAGIAPASPSGLAVDAAGRGRTRDIHGC